MYNIEIPPVIYKIITIFYGLGLWNVEDKTTDRKTGRQMFYFIYFASIFLSMLYGVCVTNDKDESIFLTIMALAVAVQVYRMYCIIWKEKEILMFIHQLGSHSTNDHQEFIQVDKKLKKMIKFVQYFIKNVFFGFLIIAILPVVSNSNELAVNVGFLFDWRNSQIGFWMMYAYTEVGFLLSGVCCLFTLLLWYLMLNFVIKYKLLGNFIRNMAVIRPTKECNVSQREQQKLFHQDMIVAIKSVQQIKELFNQFGLTFANIFFLQIITSSMCICGLVYNLAFSTHENVMQDGIYYTGLIYCLFDIFVVMYLGNEIKFSSDKLSYCLFESNWIEQTQSTKKLMIILSELLKQPEELIIGKLYPLDLATFSAIVNQAYSMFNILRNLRK